MSNSSHISFPRDAREEYATPKNVIRLSDVRGTSQPISKGARSSASRGGGAASSVADSATEVVRFNAPNVAASSVPDNESIDSHNSLIDELDDFADNAPEDLTDQIELEPGAINDDEAMEIDNA